MECVLTATLRFSTENVPPSERIPQWYDVFDRSVTRRELSPLSDAPFDMDVTVNNLGDASGAAHTGVCVQRMTFAAGFSAQRTRELLADGNDDVILYIHRSGRRVVSQLDRETTVEPGGGVLVSNAHPSTIVVPDPSRFACIAMPRKPMMSLVPGLEDLLVRPLKGDAGVLQLLDNYLTVLECGQAMNTPDLRRAILAHIHDLVAVALGATRELLEIASRRGIRAARLHAIKADIAKNLTEGEVSAGALAARHRVTPRYIHKLFENEGTTLSKFVLGQRLSRVHRMLADARCAGQTIGALAFAAGFGDLSTFNHAFRRHYGATPSEVRAAAP
jgi:AraC-like DNA-binding protein